jgi:hypothetical protein
MSNERSIILAQYNNSPKRGNNILTLTSPSPIDLSDKEVSVNYCSVYYSWWNISNVYGNNTLSVIFPSGTFDITIPDGSYSVEFLNGFLQNYFDLNNLYVLDSFGNKVYFIRLEANPIYYAVTLTIDPILVPSGGSNPHSLTTGNTPQVNISNQGFGNIIGFNTGVYPASPQATQFQQNSQKIPNVKKINEINILSNIVSPDFGNIFANNLYSAPITGIFGETLRIEPQNLSWFKCVTQNVRQIEIRLVDDQGVDIPLLDTNGFTVVLSIRDSK